MVTTDSLFVDSPIRSDDGVKSSGCSVPTASSALHMARLSAIWQDGLSLEQSSLDAEDVPSDTPKRNPVCHQI